MDVHILSSSMSLRTSVSGASSECPAPGDATRNSSACVIPNYPVDTENVQVEVGPAATSLRGAADYGVEISNHHSVSKLFVDSSIVRHCTVARRNGENAAEENI